MRRMIIIVLSTLLIPLFAVGKDAMEQLSVDTTQLLKIASQDERAVIKTPDGEMQIIKAGDLIGDRAKVIEIATDRIVIEEKMGNETEKVIIRLENGKQHAERLKQTGGLHPQVYGVKTFQEPPTQNLPLQEKQPAQIKEGQVETSMNCAHN